jgi:hypothetical protein
MNPFRLSAVIALSGLIGIGVAGTPVSSQEAAASADGVEVLARGQVHEAYAEPVSAQPKPSVVVPKQPPEPIEELPPDQKPDGDNVQWIPGYWAWDEDTTDFIWISGFWRVPPPDRRWLPGHWQQVAGGWMWVAGYWSATNVEQVNYLPPPPPSVDQGPTTPAPDASSTYVPGCWVYEQKYLWRPGHWIPYQPHWVWISAHYVWTPGGCLFVEGYWDHPLEERGLLFAPIRFARDWLLARRPFVPQFVVQHDFLIGALFVGPASQHYFFGDFFEDRYVKRGFVAWPDYRLGKGAYDPNFNYYRHIYAAEPHWETGIHELYKARFAGEVARPPHTLTQQTTVIKNFTVNKTENVVVHKNINITNVQNVTALTTLKDVHNTRVTNLGSLSGVKESKVVTTERKLVTVPKAEQVQHQAAAKVIRETSQVRREGEARLVQQGGVPVHHTDPPKPVKLPLPKPAIAPHPAVKIAPPVPVMPKHEVHEVPKYEPHPPPGPPKK